MLETILQCANKTKSVREKHLKPINCVQENVLWLV